VTAIDDDSTTYEPPTVVDYGDLVALTAGSNSGAYTDQTFPVHTPYGNLTFSS
jgi:hypothetical protein